MSQTRPARVFRLPEDVGFTNLTELRRSGEQHIDAQSEPSFDLSELVNPGSAVVALLIAWFRYAHLNGKSVEFTGMPVSLRNIIDVSELSEVLPVRDPS